MNSSATLKYYLKYMKSNSKQHAKMVLTESSNDRYSKLAANPFARLRFLYVNCPMWDCRNDQMIFPNGLKTFGLALIPNTDDVMLVKCDADMNLIEAFIAVKKRAEALHLFSQFIRGEFKEQEVLLKRNVLSR